MFWEEAANRGVNMDSFSAAQLESGVTNKYLRVLFKSIEYYMVTFFSLLHHGLYISTLCIYLQMTWETLESVCSSRVLVTEEDV